MVGQDRDVARDPARIMADLRHRPIEFGLPSTGHEHASAFGREPFGARQTDAAVGAGDDRDLAFQLAHVRLPSVDRRDMDRHWRRG